MSIKVIGAGFGRTGTGTLRCALEKLGFDKCYHMSEIMAHPEKCKAWLKVKQEKILDWDNIFTGYQATADWPCCSFYKEIYKHYPDAKVILTVRDPDDWYRSTYETIYAMSKTRNKILACLYPPVCNMKRLVNSIVWDGTFQGKFENKAYAKKIFVEHIEEVKRIIPKEQLLVYEVSQGWEPLCQFLKIPVPQQEPFPRLNDVKSMKKLVMKRFLFSMSFNFIVLILIVLLIIYLK